jgi:hypothetical protein
MEFRLIWLAIALLASVIAGAACGLLSWLGGLNAANAVLAGASAAGAVLTLAILVLHFVEDRDRTRR